MEPRWPVKKLSYTLESGSASTGNSRKSIHLRCYSSLAPPSQSGLLIVIWRLENMGRKYYRLSNLFSLFFFQCGLHFQRLESKLATQIGCGSWTAHPSYVFGIHAQAASWSCYKSSTRFQTSTIIFNKNISITIELDVENLAKQCENPKPRWLYLRKKRIINPWQLC